MSDDDKLKYIQSLLQSCFVPQLKEDIGTIPLESENFDEYRKAVEEYLPILYDFVQQNEHWIFANDQTNVQEVHGRLIVLLCEITATTTTIYKLENEDLIKNARRLLRRHLQLNDAVGDIIFEHYQQKLQKDIWKKQLGTVHSVFRFLEYRHYEVLTKANNKMSTKWLTFCLSVGLNVRECHEPVYKQISTRIFQLMLIHGDPKEIRELNIHSVIYDAVFKDVCCMETVIETADIWRCLLKCLEFYDNIDSVSWCNTDDMIETLLRNISLTSDSLISICLLKFVTKLLFFFSYNKPEIEEKISIDLSIPLVAEHFRYICTQNTSLTPFRWAKYVLKTFMNESYKLKQSPTICRQFLQEIHRCYLVGIYPIRLQVIEPLLTPFLDKFTSILMEVIVAHKRDKDIVKVIKSILITFYNQLDRSRFSEVGQRFGNLRESFEKLLQHNVFTTN